MTYTGLLLASMQAVPFWHSAWLPLLFIASDISTGIGLGFITYVVVSVATGNVKKVKPLMWVAAAAFLVSFLIS